MINSKEKLVNLFEKYSIKYILGEFEALMKEKDEVIVAVNSIKMFNVIKEYAYDEEAKVCTKYKTIEVQPTTSPILEDNEKLMKEVLILQDPKKVGHKFTKETIKELIIEGGDFLSPAEDAKFRKMLG